jgi:hypothetical protein
MATDEAQPRTVPGRQPPEWVRSKHDVSSLACDARSGRGFGLLEGSHQKGKLRHDTSPMTGRDATASACAPSAAHRCCLMEMSAT